MGSMIGTREQFLRDIVYRSTANFAAGTEAGQENQAQEELFRKLTGNKRQTKVVFQP